MLRSLRRLLCRVLWHVPLEGTNPKRAIRFHCRRCHALVPGGLAPSR